MLKHHVATTISAESACSMIAALCDDDYRIVIDHGDTLKDDYDSLYVVYSVKIVDTDDSVVATGQAYYLSDALAEAYQDTPERSKAVE